MTEVVQILDPVTITTTPPGLPGIRGNSVLSGEDNPTNAVGLDGDFYINTTSNMLYGPKAGGAWPPVGESMEGVPGPAGPVGPQGPPGTGAPGPVGPTVWATPPTAWVTATSYQATPPASVVTQANSSYVCALNHISGVFTTDLAAGKWTLLAAAGGTGGAVIGDVVTGGTNNAALFVDGAGKLGQDPSVYNYNPSTDTLAVPNATIGALLGTPAAPTAAVDTTSTQIATTAFVIGQAAVATPQALGSAAVGTSKKYAREDHVHAAPATDTSRMAVTGGQTITGGFRFAPYNGGTISSGTFTPDAYNGNYQYITNNGAFTLGVPTSDCALDLLVTNGATAGIITAGAGQGWSISASVGDPLTTTNTQKFVISIRRINGIATYTVKALQ